MKWDLAMGGSIDRRRKEYWWCDKDPWDTGHLSVLFCSASHSLHSYSSVTHLSQIVENVFPAAYMCVCVRERERERHKHNKPWSEFPKFNPGKLNITIPSPLICIYIRLAWKSRQILVRGPNERERERENNTRESEQLNWKFMLQVVNVVTHCLYRIKLESCSVDRLGHTHCRRIP